MTCTWLTWVCFKHNDCGHSTSCDKTAIAKMFFLGKPLLLCAEHEQYIRSKGGEAVPL